MIRVVNLSKAYGQKVLFDQVSFLMNPGERLGLVGRNGHGKTTLFRLLIGVERPDEGEIVVPRHYQVGHLSQSLEFCGESVLAEVCSALPQLEGGTDQSYRAEAALQGLGFSRDSFGHSPAELSGGYQVRLNLAKLLVSEPGLLLLDEPTNHLDIVSMRWLQRFLRGWHGELILITHDREFMDAVTTHTMAIHRSNLRKVEGTTRKVFGQIGQEEETHEKTRLNWERDRRQHERFIQRFRAKSSKAKAVQSRIKMLERMDDLERLEEIQDLYFRFRTAPFRAKKIMDVQELSFHYLEGAHLIEDLHLQVGRHDRIGVIGANGQGKTTLLSLLAGVLQPVQGKVRLHPSAQLAYFGQSNVARLDPEKTVEEEIRQVHPEQNRGETRKICARMMFEGDDALKKVSVLSGGEKSRVLLGKLLVSPANLLLLDEPTNHLDMQATEGLMHALEGFEGAVVMVTHSEMILRRVVDRLVVFDGDQVCVFEGGYQDFLDRVGWAQDYSEGGTTTRVREQKRSRKEMRRLRAEILAERSKVLTPLQELIGELEGTIVSREEEINQVETSLLEATKQGEPKSIARLGQRSADLREEIQSLFDELEKHTNQYDLIEPEFERRLEELK